MLVSFCPRLKAGPLLVLLLLLLLLALSGRVDAGPLVTTGWKFRLSGGGSTATRGVVEVLPAGQQQWGTLCDRRADATTLRAVCGSLGLPVAFDAPVTFAGAQESAFDGPIYLADIACVPRVLNFTRLTLANCTATAAENPGGGGFISGCTHDNDLAVDCAPGIYPPRQLTAVVRNVTYNAATFAERWSQFLHISPSSVVINASASRAQLEAPSYRFVSFSFADDTAWYPPGAFSHLGSMSSGSMPFFPHGSGSFSMPFLPAHGSGGSAMSFGSGSMPWDHHHPGGSSGAMDINARGFAGVLLQAIAAETDGGTLWGDMGIFELRDNTTLPNSGAVAPRDFAAWNLTLDASDIDSALTNQFGRLHVQPGPDVQWGTACSSNITQASLVAICQRFNRSATQATLLPHYRYGRGIIYLSDISCANFTSVKGLPTSDCSYRLSTEFDKLNNCSHVSDAGVLCGSGLRPDVANETIYAAATVTHIGQMSMGPAAVLACISSVSGVPVERMQLVETTDTTPSQGSSQGSTDGSSQDSQGSHGGSSSDQASGSQPSGPNSGSMNASQEGGANAEDTEDSSQGSSPPTPAAQNIPPQMLDGQASSQGSGAMPFFPPHRGSGSGSMSTTEGTAPTVVQFRLSPAALPEALTSGDLELMLRATNAFALSHQCSVAALHVRVDSAPSSSSSSGGSGASESGSSASSASEAPTTPSPPTAVPRTAEPTAGVEVGPNDILPFEEVASLTTRLSGNWTDALALNTTAVMDAAKAFIEAALKKASGSSTVADDAVVINSVRAGSLVIDCSVRTNVKASALSSVVAATKPSALETAYQAITTETISLSVLSSSLLVPQSTNNAKCSSGCVGLVVVGLVVLIAIAGILVKCLCFKPKPQPQPADGLQKMSPPTAASHGPYEV